MLVISVLRLDYKFKTCLGYTGRCFYFKVMANLGAVVTEPPCSHSTPTAKQRAMK